MNALDCLVVPSRTTASWKEQFKWVLIEAGACGLPVVGSDSGANPEVIGSAGLTFPEGGSAALAAFLQALKDSPERRVQYGRVGQARAQDIFSGPQVAARISVIYHTRA